MAGCAVLSYFIWLSLRPVEIIAVHQRDNYSDILVRSFPLTDKGKITWWLENQELLKNYHNIPEPDSHGLFTVNFWLFGEGYKEEGKYDRLCFNDMKTKVNCIEKDAVFSVNRDSQNRIHFTTYNGKNYLLKENGEIENFFYK